MFLRLLHSAVGSEDGSDQPPAEGVALPGGARVPGTPAGTRQQLLLPGEVLDLPHPHLPLGALPGPAEPLPQFHPGEAGHHALVCSASGLQWKWLLVWEGKGVCGVWRHSHPYRSSNRGWQSAGHWWETSCRTDSWRRWQGLCRTSSTIVTTTLQLRPLVKGAVQESRGYSNITWPWTSRMSPLYFCFWNKRLSSGLVLPQYHQSFSVT